jgi:hypothetical protein
MPFVVKNVAERKVSLHVPPPSRTSTTPPKYHTKSSITDIHKLSNGCTCESTFTECRKSLEKKGKNDLKQTMNVWNGSRDITLFFL